MFGFKSFLSERVLDLFSFFFCSFGIAAISPFSHRLSFDHLPAEIQRLRCKVNFQALRFVPHITSLGDALVSRLRNPFWRSSKDRKNVDHLGDMTNSHSRQEPGKFAVLHLRFDKVDSPLFTTFLMMSVELFGRKKFIFLCLY